MKRHQSVRLLFFYTILSLYSWTITSDFLETPSFNTINQKNIMSLWEKVFDTKKFTLNLELDTYDNQEIFLSGKIYLKDPSLFLAGEIEIKFSTKNRFVELQWLKVNQKLRSQNIGSFCIDALKTTCICLGYDLITLDAKFIDWTDVNDLLLTNQKTHALAYCKTLHFYARHNALRMPLYLQKITATKHILDKDIYKCCIPLCIPLTKKTDALIKQALIHDCSKKYRKKQKSLLLLPKKAYLPPSEMLVVQHTLNKLFPHTAA